MYEDCGVTELLISYPCNIRLLKICYWCSHTNAKNRYSKTHFSHLGFVLFRSKQNKRKAKNSELQVLIRKP